MALSLLCKYTCQGCNRDFYIDKLCSHFLDNKRRFDLGLSGWPDISCCNDLGPELSFFDSPNYFE